MPQVTRITGSLVKHMRKHPPTDAEIVSTLLWASAIIEKVIHGESEWEPDSEPELEAVTTS